MFTPDLLRVRSLGSIVTNTIQLINVIQKLVVIDMLYSPTMLMSKMSLLLLYYQIFSPNVKFRHYVHVIMGFLFLFYCGLFIAFAILTIPKPGQSLLAAFRLLDTAKGLSLSVAQSVAGVAINFIIFCLPIPVVWKLRLSLRKKIGVLAVFMTGLL